MSDSGWRNSYDYGDNSGLYLWTFVGVLLVVVVVVAALIARVVYLRKKFRLELARARATGGPVPVYRNPFLPLGYAPPPPAALVPPDWGPVPALWDEAMVLERSGLECEEKGKGKGKDGGVVRVRVREARRGSASSGESGETAVEEAEGEEGEWSLGEVQPASLGSFVWEKPLPPLPPAPPALHREVRDALRSMVPRKQLGDDEAVAVHTPAVQERRVAPGEDISLGVLIAMPSEGGKGGLDGLGEVGLGVLELKVD